MTELIITQKDLENKNPIIELSGVGNFGFFSNYYHKRTIRALKLRLTKLKSNGDRFASIYIYCHQNSDNQNVYQDIETGAYKTI